MAEMEPNTEDSHVLKAGADSPKAALLLVVGEPFSEDQRELILERITTGELELLAFSPLTARTGFAPMTSACQKWWDWLSVGAV